jgi:hypothetical protein
MPVQKASFSAITSSGATLSGTVNPEGSPGQAFLQWSTSANMTGAILLCSGDWLPNCPAVKANYTAQPFSTVLSTAPSNVTVYYQMVFYDSANSTYQYGTVRNFKTLP